MSDPIATKDSLEKSNECSVEHSSKLKRLVNSNKTLSADAPVFCPRKLGFCNKSGMKKGDDGEQSDSEMYEDALQELREALHLLTIDPGDFQQMMPNFASRFSSLVSKGVCPLSDLIEEIFEQSLCEDNFRYSGARMCDYLSQYPPFDSFKEQFISRCQREHERIMAGKTEASRVLDYAFFVGELVVNMKDGSTKGMVPEFLQQIGELMRLLMNIRSHQSILCCLKLIKLTGCSLDGCLENFDEVISSVTKLLGDDSLPRSILSLTTSVLEQRATSLRFQPQQRLGESPSSSVAGAGDSLNDDEDDHCTGSFQLQHTGLEGGSRQEEQYFIGDEVMDEETADAFHLFISRQEA